MIESVYAGRKKKAVVGRDTGKTCSVAVGSGFERIADGRVGRDDDGVRGWKKMGSRLWWWRGGRGVGIVPGSWCERRPFLVTASLFISTER